MKYADAESRLRQGVQSWNDWRLTIGRELDLRLANLYEAHLPSIDLNLADLSEANLAKANLIRANLADANLYKANLRQADLRGAVLRRANLRRANLRGVNLFEADLSEADLSGNHLQGVNFKGCNLCRANLTDADLAGADLSGAVIAGTIFGGTNLKGAAGLIECEFPGASNLDYATLQRSGMLPDVFLRGCGLPDELINYLPSFLNQPIQFYSCFISYSHNEMAFARLLHDRLQGRGIRCWLDEHQLLPGDDIHEQVDQGIRLWDKVLLCCSKVALHNSWWVDGEINRAFQKEAQIMKERGKKVLALIPINLDGFLFTNDYQSGKKAEITSRVAANFVGWEKDHALFDRELEKVIRALRTDDGGRELPPPSRL